jgi:UDP-glucose:(heptosyl)LPS alpha-1,3-glucosyltransferase
VRAGPGSPETTASQTGPTTPVILCLSDYIKSTVRKHYPLPNDRLATLFNAVDLAKFDPAARPTAGRDIRQRFNLTDQPVGLIIAQDFERKGLAEAIEALARVDQPPALVVVGKQDPADYRQLAQHLGVDQHVHFAGPTTDPYAFYAAADFFILPTRHDPCSLVVLEALAMGLPVISTKQNGACEIMTPGVHGFVLDSADDQPALVAAVRAMLDPAARDRMRAACLALRPRLAYEHHLDTLLSIYQQTARVRAQMAPPTPISPPVPPPL